MRWTRQGPSEDLEDRRGQRAGIGFGGGGMGRAAPIGLGGLLIVILLSWLTGQDFLSLLEPGGGGSRGQGTGCTDGSRRPADRHPSQLPDRPGLSLTARARRVHFDWSRRYC